MHINHAVSFKNVCVKHICNARVCMFYCILLNILNHVYDQDKLIYRARQTIRMSLGPELEVN